MERNIVVVKRDCIARLVPVGTPITIPKDTFVTVTQDLGGSFTVVVNGNMARVDSTDADALGFEPLELCFDEPTDDRVREEDVWETMRTVYDPEIPINLVDLGLIYGCEIRHENGRNSAHIRMTLTAPGCGMGPVLVEEIKYRLEKVPNLDEVEVELVFDPPWDREMMSVAAKLELGMF
ncbi:MAG: putative Fe-S cluster assembly protein SufT [Gammaproteobacteria bacterium]